MRRSRGIAALAATAGLVTGLALIGLPAQAATESLFNGATPTIKADSDTGSVTVGTKVTAKVAGRVTAVKFYKGTGNTGTHVGAVYSSNGSLSVKGNFTNETSSGWQTWTPASSIQVAAGSTFTAAVLMPKGHYAAANTYAWPVQTPSLTGTAGVYKYGTALAYPTTVYQTSNYYIDVVYTPDVVASPTPTVTPTSASPSAPPSSASPTPTDPPTTATPSPTDAPGTLMGWQVNAQTVGLAPLGLSCASLPVYTGPGKPTTGTVISGKLITGGLDLSDGGITIEKSCIQPTSNGRGMPVLTTTDNNSDFLPGDQLVTIRDSEIDGSKLSTEDAAYATGFIGVATLQRNYVHHLGSGLALYHTGMTLNALVENNYVTDLIGWGNPATTGNHSDAFTIRDFNGSGRTAKVQNNRFDCDSVNPTGAFFIQGQGDFIDNVTAQGNLLEGGGWLMGLEMHNNGYGTHISSINNRFNPQGFGSAYVTGGPGYAQWVDNYRYDPTQPDAKGAVVAEP